MMNEPEWKLMPPAVREKYLEILRAISPGERLRIALDLSDMARKLTMSGIRSQHPDWSEHQVQIELFRRILPPDLFEKVYGDNNAKSD